MKNLHPQPSSGGKLPAISGFAASFLTFIIVCFFSDQLSFTPSYSSLKKKTVTFISWEIETKIESDNLAYAEANPQVPENIPENTNLFSFRDQQAANPNKSEPSSEAKIPKLEGSEQNFKIIKNQEYNSQNAQPLDELPINIDDSDKPHSNTDYDSYQSSNLKVSDKSKVDNPNGTKLDPAIKNLNLGTHNEINDSLKNTPDLKPKESRPLKLSKRKRVESKLLNGPILKSTSFAPRIGSIAIESKLHPYGIYMQQMLKAIEEQWTQLVRGSISFIKRDRLPGKITIRFILNADGKISDLERIDQQKDGLATDLCRQSILSRAPFGKWTQEMIKDLGNSDLVTINFIYN